jgi:hypothetical protein
MGARVLAAELRSHRAPELRVRLDASPALGVRIPDERGASAGPLGANKRLVEKIRQRKARAECRGGPTRRRGPEGREKLQGSTAPSRFLSSG